jgi:hypothetical protein
MNAAMTFCETHANMTEGFWSLLRYAIVILFPLGDLKLRTPLQKLHSQIIKPHYH